MAKNALSRYGNVITYNHNVISASRWTHESGFDVVGVVPSVGSYCRATKEVCSHPIELTKTVTKRVKWTVYQWIFELISE